MVNLLSRVISNKDVYRYAKKWIQQLLLKIGVIEIKMEELDKRISKLEDNNAKTT